MKHSIFIVFLYIFLLLKQGFYSRAQSFDGPMFKVSTTGVNGDNNLDARLPDAIYNPVTDQFLVVWESDHNLNGKFEIFGRLVNASTGALIGTSDLQISLIAPGDARYDAREPAVTYNSNTGQFLVVWHGADNAFGLDRGEFEIFGQFLDNNGNLLGSSFRISDVGGSADNSLDAIEADVCFNVTSNEFMVVWNADDTDQAGIVDNEREIYGQRLDGNGNLIGTNDFRISFMGGTGNNNFQTNDPSVVWNSVDNEYLVVWDADEFIDGRNDIFGQRMDNIGGLLGPSLLIATTNASNAEDMDMASVCYSPNTNEYLVSYDGEINISGFNQAFTRVVSSNGILGAETLISSETDQGTDQEDVVSIYIPYSNEYLSIWRGDEPTFGTVVGEDEVFIQQIDRFNTTIGTPDVRVSNCGPDFDNGWDVFRPGTLAYSSTSNRVLVAWEGEHNVNGMVNGESEIWARLWIPPAALPVEFGTFDASVINDHVQLDWTTYTETNSDYFIVERSRNGFDQWEEVEQIIAAGNSVNLERYSFIDDSPIIGRSYYRLRQVDTDGSYSYSKIVSVIIDVKDQSFIYPNPAEEIIFIEGLAENRITIYNNMGQIVNQDTKIQYNGSSVRVDISLLPTGVYVVSTTYKHQLLNKL